MVNLLKQLIVIKESKAGAFVQVAPEYRKLKNHYQLLWDQPDCIGYIKTVAVLQVFTDQGISADTWYSGKFFRSADPEQDGKVPITLVAKNLMLAHKWGVKSFYYDLRDKQSSREMTQADDLQTKQDPIKPLTIIPPAGDYIQGANDGEDYCESCTL